MERTGQGSRESLETSGVRNEGVKHKSEVLGVYSLLNICGARSIIGGSRAEYTAW